MRGKGLKKDTCNNIIYINLKTTAGKAEKENSMQGIRHGSAGKDRNTEGSPSLKVVRTN